MGHVCNCSWITTPHKTFGECMRGKNIRVAYCQSASGRDYTAQKKWDKNLDKYASTRAEGIQPKTTNAFDIEMAQKISDSEGVAFGGTG